ncbi:MAG: GntR family transcriptional regulator [Fimbriimonas sp.]
MNARKMSAKGTVSFKHEAVAQALKDGIAQGLWKPGEKIPSEHELASRFGVAYMTARQAVSSLEREGLLERIARKGTFVATPIPANPARHVYLLLQGARLSLDPLYFPHIAAGFERELAASEFEMSLYDYKVALGPDTLPPGSLVVCLLIREEEADHARTLAARGHRVLVINRSGVDGLPCVSPDNAGGARTAVEHLMDLGHDRIGLIAGPPDNLDARERNRGYLEAFSRRDRKPGPQAGDGFDEDSGYRAVNALLAAGAPFDALFCASDVSAVGAMTALKEAGIKVPGDVSIVGFGDFPIARFWEPGLTTVQLQLAELGTQAARATIRLFHGDNVGEELLPVNLVMRNSTAPAPVVELA